MDAALTATLADPSAEPQLPESLYGLTVTPAAVRPGELLHVELTLHNRGAGTSPAAPIRLLFPRGLEAAGAPPAPIPALAPGESFTARCAARAAAGLPDGTVLAVQAAVRIGGDERGTNVATAQVRAEPRLDGPGTVLSVTDLGDGDVRLDLTVVNDGDGAADEVVAVIPPQRGLAAAETTVALGTLAPGERRSAAAVLALGACSDGAIAIERVALHDASGRCTVLAAVAETRIAPRLATPEVQLDDDGDHVAIRIVIAAAGPVHLDDVEVRVALPDGVRIAPHSLRVDDIPVRSGARGRGVRPAHARIAPDGVTFALRRIPGGGDAAVRCSAHRSGFTGGRVSVEIAAAGTVQRLVAELAPPLPRAPGLLLVAPPPLHDGTPLEVAVEITAAVPGAVALTAHGAALVAIDGRAPAPLAIAPGEVRACTLTVLPHDGAAALTLVAAGPDGETALPVALVARPAAAASATAGDAFAAVAPPPVTATLLAPASAVAGATIEVAAALDTAAAIETLIVRLPAGAAAGYVAGSTRVGGHPVLDGTLAPLLAGLALHGLPAATATTVAWRVLVAPDAAPEITLRAEVLAGGAEVALAPRTLAVIAPDAFAARPPGLRFHVGAALAPAAAEPLAPESAAAEPPVEPVPWIPDWTALAPGPPAATLPEPSLGATFGAARADDVLRLLHGGERPGLVAHVLALRVLFPDATDLDDARVDAALAALHEAAGDALDRLFVKVRIPAYDVAGTDCEDGASRIALTELLDALACSGAPARHVAVDARVALDRELLAARRDAVAVVPLGDAAALAALAALVPDAAADEGVGAAAARYGALLRVTLDAFAARPPAEFDHALMHERDDALDAARRAFIAALQRVAAGALR